MFGADTASVHTSSDTKEWQMDLKDDRAWIVSDVLDYLQIHLKRRSRPKAIILGSEANHICVHMYICMVRK